MNKLENNTMDKLENNTADNTGNDRTFTQEDVNRIVQERLSREWNKAASDQDRLKELEERERALTAREQAITRKAVLKSKNIPEEVYEALNCTSEESFNKSLEILSPYFQKLNEPIMNPVRPVGGSFHDDSLRKAMGLK